MSDTTYQTGRDARQRDGSETDPTEEHLHDRLDGIATTRHAPEAVGPDDEGEG